MIRKERKNFLILLGLLLLFQVAFFAVYIARNLPMVYGTDLRPQWFLFFEEFRNLITQFFTKGTYPFYSWSLFLGSNFFASKSYYLMGDLFNYIGYLFPTDFFTMNMILDMLKFFVCGIGMFTYLYKRGVKGNFCVLGSLLYTFSGWAIFYSGQMSFLSFYAWVPWYFWAMENYITEKKGMWFIVFTTILLFTNYYFFFTVSLLSPLYFLYRYAQQNKTLKGWFKACLPLIGYYLVGCLITMILTLPTIYYMLGNDRAGHYTSRLIVYPIQVYFHYLLSLLSPNYMYIYGNNVFETANHFTREICMYAGVLSAILIPQTWVTKDAFANRTNRILYLIFGIILCIPILDGILHGLSDPSLRWVFFIVFMNVTLSMQVLSKQEINPKVLKVTAIVAILYLVFVVPVTATIQGQSISAYLPQIQLLGVSVAWIVLYYWLLRKGGKQKVHAIIAIGILEIGSYSTYMFNNLVKISETQDYTFLNQVTHVLQDQPGELMSYLNNIEPMNVDEYYRVYIPHESIYWSYSHNMALIYQLNGTMSYDSTYAPSLNSLKAIDPSMKDFESEWIFNIKDASVLDFLSVKYAIVTKEEELPEGIHWRLLSDSYRTSFLVYRNDDYMGLGTSYSEVAIQDENTRSNQLLTTVVCNKKDYDTIQDAVSSTETTLQNVHYQGNYLSGDYQSEDHGFMVISLPYDDGWKVKIDGQPVTTYEVNGGFIGIAFPEGSHTLEMVFTPKGFKQGAILSVVGILLFIALGIRTYKLSKKKNDVISN